MALGPALFWYPLFSKLPLGPVTSCGSSFSSRTAGACQRVQGCAHSSTSLVWVCWWELCCAAFTCWELIVLASSSVPGGTDLPRPDFLGGPQDRAALFKPCVAGH